MLQHLNTKPKNSSNILHFESETHSDNQQNRQDDLKNEYSTFIQELEETTQKLMNEVFNAEYKPQPNYQWEEEEGKGRADGKAGKIVKGKRRSILDGYKSGGFGGKGKEEIVEGTQSFKNFITRNSKWCEKKQTFINKQLKKKEIQEQKELTLVPQILRGSIEKLEPIYERALQLHASKEKKRAYKKIQEKRKEDEQINSLPFHPEITSKAKTRSLQQYLEDKKKWEQRKNQGRQVRKLKQEAQKYTQCSFAPNLISKQIQQKVLRVKPGEKVQERLLRSLQKAFAEA